MSYLEALLASVREQLFKEKNIKGVSNLIENRGHAAVHSNLGGSMAVFASPADPIFWSHHFMVDALHTIFHKCRVGTQRMTFEQKVADAVAWVSCERDGGRGPPFNPTDIVTVRTGTNANSVNATEDPVVSHGQLASLYTGCDGSATPTSTPIAATNAPAPTTNAPQPITRMPTSTTATPEPLATNAPEPRTDAPAPVPTTAFPPVTADPLPTAALPSTNVPTNNQQMQDARRFFDWLWNNLFPNNTRSFRKLAAEGDETSRTSSRPPGVSRRRHR
ncbi:unnamed protein product [Phytophthora lilii]|uniref:Unnamed protein product n=1 Tax=Phytophthora lilii TaxID=2077276 RepID=A0A9W7D861_9STRA|nr:unnamed protein product [Phytophthora lilii]